MYDFKNWHKTCTNKQVVDAGGQLYIICHDCGVCANMEAISAKVSPADACKVGDVNREVIGQQSPNVDKGATK